MKWLSTQQAQRVTTVWALLRSLVMDTNPTKKTCHHSVLTGVDIENPNAIPKNGQPARSSSQVSKRGQITHFFFLQANPGVTLEDIL